MFHVLGQKKCTRCILGRTAFLHPAKILRAFVCESREPALNRISSCPTFCLSSVDFHCFASGVAQHHQCGHRANSWRISVKHIFRRYISLGLLALSLVSHDSLLLLALWGDSSKGSGGVNAGDAPSTSLSCRQLLFVRGHFFCGNAIKTVQDVMDAIYSTGARALSLPAPRV